MTAASYWPWWLGAASLGAVTVSSCIVARRPLGVSGILGRFVRLREELAVERQRRAAAADHAALEAALLAATADAFGAAAPVAPGAARDALEAAPPGCAGGEGACGSAPEASARGPARAPCGGECRSPAARPTLGAHAVFLLSIALGGLVVQLCRGAWSARLDMGPTFAALHGGGARGALVLLGGGLLVGIGTTVSGGCSTGHGLSGCSRLQPGSVAATMTFLGMAMLVSCLLSGGTP